MHVFNQLRFNTFFIIRKHKYEEQSDRDGYSFQCLLSCVPFRSITVLPKNELVRSLLGIEVLEQKELEVSEEIYISSGS